jgi:hypothetical protein
VRRKALLNERADHLLGLDVGFGDRRLVGLQRDREVALIVATDDLGAGARGFQCSAQERGRHAGSLTAFFLDFRPAAPYLPATLR